MSGLELTTSNNITDCIIEDDNNLTTENAERTELSSYLFSLYSANSMVIIYSLSTDYFFTCFQSDEDLNHYE